MDWGPGRQKNIYTRDSQLQLHLELTEGLTYNGPDAWTPPQGILIWLIWIWLKVWDHSGEEWRRPGLNQLFLPALAADGVLTSCWLGTFSSRRGSVLLSLYAPTRTIFPKASPSGPSWLPITCRFKIPEQIHGFLMPSILVIHQQWFHSLHLDTSPGGSWIAKTKIKKKKRAFQKIKVWAIASKEESRKKPV